MTEKEFLAKVTGESLPFSVTPSKSTVVLSSIAIVADEALKLAKQQGAKFDPEKVELPKLAITAQSTYGKNPRYHIILAQPVRIEDYNASSILLTEQQALEVIRRCRVVDKLREYINSTHKALLMVGDILQIINEE